MVVKKLEGAYARAAVNDIADALSMIDRAIHTLELDDRQRKVFTDFAEYVARAAQKRVTRSVYREHVLERENDVIRLSLKDWQELYKE